MSTACGTVLSWFCKLLYITVVSYHSIASEVLFAFLISLELKRRKKESCSEVCGPSLRVVLFLSRNLRLKVLRAGSREEWVSRLSHGYIALKLVRGPQGKDRATGME